MPMQMNINKSGSENSGQYSGAGFGFDNSYNNTSFLPRLQQQPTYDPQQMQYQQQEYLQHQKQQQVFLQCYLFTFLFSNSNIHYLK